MIRKIKKIPHYAWPGIEKFTSEGLAWIYRAPGGPLQRAIFPQLFRLHQFGLRLRHNGPGQVYLASGLSARSGLPFKVAFLGKWTAGDDSGLNYYQHALFREGTAVRQHLGSIPVRDYRRKAEDLAGEVDLAVFVEQSSLVWQPPTGEWVSGPSYVRMAFDFLPGQSWADTVKRIDQEYNLRVLRKTGLTFRTSRRKEDFEFFYHKMYVPLISGRFKDAGGILKESDLYNFSKKMNGFIMLIEDPDGNPVSGGLAYIWRDVFFNHVNGVLDGDPALIKKGALTAWYYFGMRMAYEQGCKRFDSGQCKAYLADGLYIHKHRWGEEASLNYWAPYSVLLWAPSGSPEALDWMKANPLLPRFASWGGQKLSPFYTALKQEEMAPKPSERKARSKPVEAEPQAEPEAKAEARPEKVGLGNGRSPAGGREKIEDHQRTHLIRL